MAQFTVHRNKNSKTKIRIPYLLDVQSDLLAALETRVVVPLYSVSTLKGAVLTRLAPKLEVEGKQCVMQTPQLAGISKKELGAEVADLTICRDEIMAAMDFLITGI